MNPENRVVDLLRIVAVSALVAVAFVPFVAVGTQPYAAIGFIERINALLGMQAIEGGWRVPPTLALITSVSAVVALLLPRTHRTTALLAVAVLATFAAISAYRFAGQSAILHPLLGPRLLIVGATFSFGAVAVEARLRLPVSTASTSTYTRGNVSER